MSIDLNGLIEPFQRGLGEIPPIVIALGLLAGPTIALGAYRLIGIARRIKTSTKVVAAPLWVCHDCRSVNDFRLSRCYRCGIERDTTDLVEVILDQRSGPPATFDVPAGSPFAALGANAAKGSGQSPGTPVMADRALGSDPIAVGPGHPDGVLADGTVAEVDETADAGPAVEAIVPAPGTRQTSPVERHT